MAVDARVLEAFSKQVRWCRELGSPFTAGLLHSAWLDLEQTGPLADLIGHWPGDPAADALPLRLAGALHALVLSGADADLANHYPPLASGSAEPNLWPAVLRALEIHRPLIDRFLSMPPQTNEIRRSAVLLGGFMEIQRSINMPLYLLEIGASAGLNSNWDRYCYRLGDAIWGDPASPVQISTEWSGHLPPLQPPAVVGRAACDLSPIDLEDAAQRLRLRAYVWADQRDRLARLDAAIAMTRQLKFQVEQADAAPWLEAHLATARTGAGTVIYHSIMWQYLPAASQARIRQALERAGKDAGRDAPIAWLRFEPGNGKLFELRLTLWPDGTEHLLATAHPHGASVAWKSQMV
ncbi:MAG: DUF2332 domain-containing protein [Dongiaceae bacterium]